MLQMPKGQVVEAKHNEELSSILLYSSDLAFAVRVTPPIATPILLQRTLLACASARETAIPSGGRGSHYRTHAPLARKPRPYPCAGSRAPAVSRGGAVGGDWARRRAPVRACARAPRAGQWSRRPWHVIRERLGRLVARSVCPSAVPSWRTRPVRCSWAPASPSCPSRSCT